MLDFPDLPQLGACVLLLAQQAHHGPIFSMDLRATRALFNQAQSAAPPQWPVARPPSTATLCPRGQKTRTLGVRPQHDPLRSSRNVIEQQLASQMRHRARCLART
eukprot:2716051-Amphidinium_carterae.1